jgi:hypothetical protein
MAIPEDAIETEAERFKSLTSQFRDRFADGATGVGEDDQERQRVYEILVSINEFLEEKLRKA